MEFARMTHRNRIDDEDESPEAKKRKRRTLHVANA
jgi:hypothetical protein